MDVAIESLGLYVAPPVSHLELAARVPGYRPGDLEALMDERRLIGLRCLRGSAFLMATDVLSIVVPATRDRNVRAFGNYLRKHLTTATYGEWADRVDGVLGDEMLSKAQIKERLVVPEADLPYMTNVISQMATESRLIGVRVPASWRSAGIAYTRWNNWLPDVDVTSPDVEEARVELAQMYFGSWGPATIDDFAWWSGLTKTQARAATEASGVAPGIVDGTFGVASGDPPRGARLLPIWDTLFVTWTDRSRFIPGSLLPYVYDSMGNATSVLLLDGSVAGVWGMGSEDDPLEIRVAPFADLTSQQWDAVEEEAEVIGGLAAASETRVVRMQDPPPNLREGKRNLFMRPV